MPDIIFLRTFGAHFCVRKGRDRIKRRDGSVERLDTDARSPKRKVVYVLTKPRKLPGKVPVADAASQLAPSPMVRGRPEQVQRNRGQL